MAMTRWSAAQPGQVRSQGGRTGQSANPQQSDPAQNRGRAGLPTPRRLPPQNRGRLGGALGQPGPGTGTGMGLPPVNRGDPYGRLQTLGPESLRGFRGQPGQPPQQMDRGFNLPPPDASQMGELQRAVQNRLGPQGPPGQAPGGAPKPPGGGQRPTAMAGNFGGGK